MNRKEGIYSLQLHNQAIAHDKIQAQAGIQADITIDHRHNNLPFQLQAPFGQLKDEANFINALQETWAQGAVDGISAIHHLMSGPIQL